MDKLNDQVESAVEAVGTDGCKQNLLWHNKAGNYRQWKGFLKCFSKSSEGTQSYSKQNTDFHNLFLLCMSCI